MIYILNHVEDNIPLLLENDSDKQRAMDKTVKVHIIMGKVNGYYDCHKNVPEEWPEILENAQYQDMDVLGQYAHVTWRVSDFQTYTSDVTMLLNNYDKLVWLEEEFIGLVKYGKLFNNRMHFPLIMMLQVPMPPIIVQFILLVMQLKYVIRFVLMLICGDHLMKLDI